VVTLQAGKSVKALKFLTVKNINLKSFQFRYPVFAYSNYACLNKIGDFCQIPKKRNFVTLTDHFNTWFQKAIIHFIIVLPF
jgi:hypothetical protein